MLFESCDKPRDRRCDTPQTLIPVPAEAALLTQFLEVGRHETIQNHPLVQHFADELSLHRVPGHSFCTLAGAINPRLTLGAFAVPVPRMRLKRLLRIKKLRRNEAYFSGNRPRQTASIPLFA